MRFHHNSHTMALKAHKAFNDSGKEHSKLFKYQGSSSYMINDKNTDINKLHKLFTGKYLKDYMLTSCLGTVCLWFAFDLKFIDL